MKEKEIERVKKSGERERKQSLLHLKHIKRTYDREFFFQIFFKQAGDNLETRN